MFSFFGKKRQQRLEEFQKQHDAFQKVKITNLVMRPEFLEAGRKLMQKKWLEQIQRDIMELQDHDDIRVRRVVQELKHFTGKQDVYANQVAED